MEIRMPDEIRQVIALLEAGGYEAWLVGGGIRDCLLGKDPKDWDIATSAKPASIQEILKDTARIVPVGAKFGTISLVSPSQKAEISTFRGGSLEEDLAMRDFSINAMAWHPRWGFQDPHGGRADMQNGIIRCPGPARDIFRADALRMIRAARFAAQLGYRISQETLAAIRELHDLIEDISPERIRDELSAILVCPRPSLGLEILKDTGLLKAILPELQVCVGFDQHNPHHDKDVYQHIVAVVENTPPVLGLRLAALFHDIAKPLCLTVDEEGIGHFYGHEQEGSALTGRIMRRLRYDSAAIARVKRLVAEHMLRINYPRMNPAKLLARVGRENLDELFALQEADARGGVHRSGETIEQMRKRVKDFLAKGLPYSRADLAITGRDLLELGIPAGAPIGKVLDKLLAAVLENPGLNERDKLIQMARSIKK